MLTTLSTTALSESARPLTVQVEGPTPLQTARWNAVQKAKRRGLSIRGGAREVGILRDTAKKYMEAVSPPMKLDSGRIGAVCYHREQHE